MASDIGYRLGDAADIQPIYPVCLEAAGTCDSKRHHPINAIARIARHAVISDIVLREFLGPMVLTFGDLCSLLEGVEKISTRRPRYAPEREEEQIQRYVAKWFDEHREELGNFFVRLEW